jgi:hypothetical protein
MSLAEIQTQIKTRWNQYHGEDQALQALKTKVSRLEAIIRANNLDLDMASTA